MSQGTRPSSTATRELTVPRSMPISFGTQPPVVAQNEIHPR
jgi:hypothetical protein